MFYPITGLPDKSEDRSFLLVPLRGRTLRRMPRGVSG